MDIIGWILFAFGIFGLFVVWAGDSLQYQIPTTLILVAMFFILIGRVNDLKDKIQKNFKVINKKLEAIYINMPKINKEVKSDEEKQEKKSDI